MPTRRKKTARFKGRIQAYADDWGCYIRVPDSASEAIGAVQRSRLLCTVNSRERFPCALLKTGKGGHPCISLSKARVKELETRPGAMVQVELQLDRSKYGMPLPAELEECLKQDREAQALFDTLLPGKQRNIIYFITAIRNPETRFNRAFTVLERLKELEPGAKDLSPLFKGGTEVERRKSKLSADEQFLSKFFKTESEER